MGKKSASSYDTLRGLFVGV